MPVFGIERTVGGKKFKPPIGGDEDAVFPPPPGTNTFYELNEDGGRAILEDGTGLVLLEASP